MSKKLLSVAILLAVFTILLCTNPQNPFTVPGNARVSLTLRDSNNHQNASQTVVSDTVGKTIKIGVCPYLYSFVDSVMVTLGHFNAGADSVIVLKTFTSDIDTVWLNFTFSSARKCTVSVLAAIQGGTQYAVSGEITIFGKPVSATIHPAADTLAIDSLGILSVNAVGDGPFSYQWLHGTTPLTGKTDVSLGISQIAFTDSGPYFCFVTDKWGDTATSSSARLIVIPKSVVKINTKPSLNVTGRRNILSTEICTLAVSAADLDSGQKDVITLVKGPSGNKFVDNIFIWTPPAGFLGADTVAFVATDNGVPPLSDTQTVVIVVSASILLPDSVKGIAGVSRIGGLFIFKWNKVANADAYIVFRSKDTTGSASYDTLSDTTFTNTIKDTAFYYYVVAMNSKGLSAPSPKIRSTIINALPKWFHSSIAVTISEGTTFSFSCADSCKDTNGDDISFQLVSAGGVNDSLVGAVWRYSPSYTDSGSYAVKIKAWDGTDSSILTIALHVVNVPRLPQPQPQSLSTNRNTPLQITLSALDPDGDAITAWVIDTQTTHGTAVLANASQPTVTYTPATGYIGMDYFTFRASVGSLTSSYSAKVSILVDTSKVVPQISSKLVAQTLKQGDSLVLTITLNANAFPAPLYSWYKAGAFLDSTRTNMWKKLNMQGTDSGFYYVIVSNIAGKDSSGANVSVNVPPVITTQPVAQAVTSGASASFTVVANGIPAPMYQWKKNGANCAGASATAATFTIATTAIADTGSYTVDVTNVAGTVTSAATRLTVNVAPVISTTLPSAIAVCPGDSSALSIVISVGATPTPTYQWYVNGTLKLGATSASFPKRWLPTDAGTYKIVVSNSAGKDSSQTVLAVNTPPSIGTQPVSQTVWATDTAKFTVIASGTAPFTYQWKKNGVNIPGATSATCKYAGISYPADSGTVFTCIVKNGCSDSATSNSAVLKIKAIKAVSAGYDYSLILMTDGSLWSCGNNTVGQLGIGVSAPSPVPVHVADSVKAVSAGCVTGASSHSLILKSDGSAWACGDDSYGELGDGASSQQNSFQKITAITNVRAVSAGYYNTLLNKNDNTLWGCGWNQFAQLGNGTTNDMGALGQVASNVQKIYLAGISSLYLKTDGSVWTAGQDDGQFGAGTSGHTDSVPVPIMASKYQSFTGVTDLCGAGDPGSDYYFFLKYDQTVWIDEAGVDSFPMQVVTSPGNPLTGITSISGGDNFRFAVKSDGTLWGWGDNSSGQLGDGTTNPQANPVQVSTNIQCVSAGNSHALIVKKDGSLWGCGSNSHGQLGTSTPTIIKSPVQIRF